MPTPDVFTAFLEMDRFGLNITDLRVDMQALNERERLLNRGVRDLPVRRKRSKGKRRMRRIVLTPYLGPRHRELVPHSVKHTPAPPPGLSFSEADSKIVSSIRSTVMTM